MISLIHNTSLAAPGALTHHLQWRTLPAKSEMADRGPQNGRRVLKKDNKNLKLKTFIFGSCRPKMKKSKDGFWKKMNSLPCKGTLILIQKCIGENYKHFYISFIVPILGHFWHTSPAYVILEHLIDTHKQTLER